MGKRIYLQSHETAMGTRLCKKVQDESRNKCFSQNPFFKLWNAKEEHRKSIGRRIYSWEQRWESGQDTSMEFTQAFIPILHINASFQHYISLPPQCWQTFAAVSKTFVILWNFCRCIQTCLPLKTSFFLDLKSYLTKTEVAWLKLKWLRTT